MTETNLEVGRFVIFNSKVNNNTVFIAVKPGSLTLMTQEPVIELDSLTCEFVHTFEMTKLHL